MSSPAPKKAIPEAPTIRELVTYRLLKATYYTTKPAYMLYSRKYKVTGVEWRLIGNLFTDGPLTLVKLAEEADIQLAQASRMITALIKRGLVLGVANENDGRSVKLSLTAEGKALYRKIFAEAQSRHNRLLEGLNKTEQQYLYQALDKLADIGREMLEEERLADK
ncbi:MAG: winged helix DNA-binding protein [Burkholderiaceae bacterium]|nr:winged helix DNA-binding protein [Burkholderiaceae bacterium]MBT9502659.1 winged helix DNA-binding protein [Burkholderiaceae bacterium]